MGSIDGIKLEVLICTIGAEGMARVATSAHPAVPGVLYTVCWQQPDGPLTAPDALTSRADFRVLATPTRGLSVNRNFALEHACGECLLIGDDDVDYSAQGLAELIAAFEEHAEADILCCRYLCRGRHVKPYGEGVFDVRRAPKGWYATSFEIALRGHGVCSVTPFNEHFGLGAPLFRAGEEDVWLYDCRRRGARALGVPVTIGEHNADTTSERHGRDDWYVMTKGAVLSHIKPRSWRLRVLVHALREKRAGRWPLSRYVRLAFDGASLARHNDVFPGLKHK